MTFSKSKHRIPFNRPFLVGKDLEYITKAFAEGWISGDGPYTKKVQALLEEQLGVNRVLLTTSCTHALEISAILLDLKPGDEIIIPSFTFVSTALAFVMHGGTPVFADIRRDTLNIDETLIESLITDKTRAIVPVHYAGVGCDMDKIMEIADKHGLIVIEDNAHGLYGKYRNRYLGTIGHMATQSFHETKNITCGEGGALIINDPEYAERAEILREKGTNRARFFRGEIDKYTWVDKGSSYVISDILAAFLYGQLFRAEEIQSNRRASWEYYNEKLYLWANKNNVQLPSIPEDCNQAYHMFYLIMPDLQVRTRFLEYLNQRGINAVFHYLPLHASEMGQKLGRTSSNCATSLDISDRIVRLPFYNGLSREDLQSVVDTVTEFVA